MSENKKCNHLWIKVRVIVDHQNYVVKKCYYCGTYHEEYERDTKKVYYSNSK